MKEKKQLPAWMLVLFSLCAGIVTGFLAIIMYIALQALSH